MSASGPISMMGLQIIDIGFQLAVMRCNITGKEKQLAHCMRFFNAFAKNFFLAEFIIAYTQAVAWLTGIHRIRAIGIGKTHMV